MNFPVPPSQLPTEKQLPRLTPGWQGLNAAAIQAWLVLALIGLGSGIVWRITGVGPSVFTLFDGLGFAYWLVPWLLISGWENMRSRQTRHISRGQGIYGLAIANALKMLQYLLLVSLAPLGLFTPFNQANPAAQFNTDMFDLPVGYPEFVLVTLLLSGSIVLCYSLACLIGARRVFGPGFGVVVWGIVGTALNASVLAGENLWGINLSFGGLAELARSALNIGLVDPAQVVYVTDAVRLVYGVLLVVLLAGAALLVLLQAPYKLRRMKPDIFLLPALLGMLVPAFFTYSHTSRWVGDPSTPYPLDWLGLFTIGTITLLVTFTISAWQQDGPRKTRLNPGGLLLLWLCPLAWVAYANPAVQAGQAGKLQLAFACTVCLLLVLLWVVAVNFLVGIRPAHPLGRGVIFAALLASLVVPLSGSQQSGMALLLVATCTAGLLAAALGVAVWWYGRRSGTGEQPF